MKTTILTLGLFLAAPASAQVHVTVGVPSPPHPTITVTAPSVTFVAPPPLVTVEPGIQVVADHDDEIFFHDSWYWLRRDGRWWRTHDHRGGWAVVEESYVPAPLIRVAPGHYRHYKHHGRGHESETVIVNPPAPHNGVKVKVKHH